MPQSGSEGKVSARNAGDPGLIPESGRSPGEGNGNPLQYSCLENPMDRGAWQATVHRVPKSRTQLSDFTYLACCCCCLAATQCLFETYGLQPARLLWPWDFLGKNTGIGNHLPLPGVFLTQGLNLGLLIGKQILLPLSHQGSPNSKHI